VIRAISHSIRRKLMLVVLFTTFAALLVAATALIYYDVRSYRQSSVDNLVTQAEILARASAPALAFNDAKSAEENLRQLRARPNFLGAALYLPDGRLFASFNQDGEERIPEKAEPAGWHFEGERLLLFHPIRERDETVGFVYLSARHRVGDRLADYLVIVVAVMAGSFLVALLISAWLQDALTRPILEVAGVAKEVMQRRDYSLKARKTTDDEIGELVDAFNAMLLEVGRRERALEEADRRKDEFLATLAHELRNPLAPVVNALQILRLAPDEATSARARAIMERQLRQLVRLVDDLLDVSRITTGKLTIKSQRFELGVAIHNAVETVSPLVTSMRHELDVEAACDHIFVEGDATRLSQVFANLLNNAAKYTPAGGRIVLRCELAGDGVVVSIRDNGIGIERGMLAPIFDMFAQADHSLERKTAGLGVGLTLARRLVELHGGRLEARSDGLGKGSEFVVRLPLAQRTPELGEASVMAAGASPAANAQRILLVDDNTDFSTSLAELLRAFGHDVRIAASGAEGLGVAADYRPKFGFLDIGMPGMNGYDLARAMRALPGGEAIVLTAVTGWGQEADRQRARESGFDHHLTKPVEVDRIRAILETTPGPAREKTN
jgi:two-component system, sensor histidine kinase